MFVVCLFGELGGILKDTTLSFVGYNYFGIFTKQINSTFGTLRVEKYNVHICVHYIEILIHLDYEDTRRNNRKDRASW